MFRDHNNFRPPAIPAIKQNIRTCGPSLNQKGTPMRCGGNLEPVKASRGSDKPYHANGHIAACQVVVDGRGDADNRGPMLASHIDPACDAWPAITTAPPYTRSHVIDSFPAPLSNVSLLGSGAA